MLDFQRLLVALLALALFASLGTAAPGPLGPDDNETYDDSEEGGNNKAEDSGDEDQHFASFMLFTRKNPETYELLEAAPTRSIEPTVFDPSKDTKILVHGWRNAWNSNFSATLRNAYLEHYDCNVINVDWSRHSRKNYLSSRMAVPRVAADVVELVDHLVIDMGVKSSSIHIVGHSLGAHIAGIAGLKLTTGNVSRITGLDPALPMFTVYDGNRLRPDSADFVDVIHSCGNLLGFKSPLGQVDFYPNGGTFVQPGCGFDYKGKCSHGRAYLFFAESMKNNRFMAVKCNNWNDFKQAQCDFSQQIAMGEYAPTHARGSYYLSTNKDAPFGRGPAVPPPTTPSSDSGHQSWTDKWFTFKPKQ